MRYEGQATSLRDSGNGRPHGTIGCGESLASQYSGKRGQTLQQHDRQDEEHNRQGVAMLQAVTMTDFAAWG
ncbi:hypothetical protein B398_00530 [Xylella fastidiosa 32]|nr:hypothetical protein XFFB_00535 [Xylella fastidiosa]AVI19962.1 hypothetical protein BCV75_00510 [Xylella fastidiosa]ETE36299.1 hypothetical protein B398_00530 [Xylella fastidiosa 32]